MYSINFVKVGPASSTLVQHCTNVIHMFRVCWDRPTIKRCLRYAGTCNPANTKHLYNIHTMLDQRRRRWADLVEVLCKCFVFLIGKITAIKSGLSRHVLSHNRFMALFRKFFSTQIENYGSQEKPDKRDTVRNTYLHFRCD